MQHRGLRHVAGHGLHALVARGVEVPPEQGMQEVANCRLRLHVQDIVGQWLKFHGQGDALVPDIGEGLIDAGLFG